MKKLFKFFAPLFVLVAGIAEASFVRLTCKTPAPGSARQMVSIETNGIRSKMISRGFEGSYNFTKTENLHARIDIFSQFGKTQLNASAEMYSNERERPRIIISSSNFKLMSDLFSSWPDGKSRMWYDATVDIDRPDGWGLRIRNMSCSYELDPTKP